MKSKTYKPVIEGTLHELITQQACRVYAPLSVLVRSRKNLKRKKKKRKKDRVVIIIQQKADLWMNLEGT